MGIHPPPSVPHGIEAVFQRFVTGDRVCGFFCIRDYIKMGVGGISVGFSVV
jgi:hypothetical protein